MRKNSAFFILSTILLSAIFYNFSCNRCYGYYIENITQIKMDVFPQQEVYSVGDTIWLSTEFDKSLELTNQDGTANIGEYAYVQLLFYNINGNSSDNLLGLGAARQVEASGEYSFISKAFQFDCSEETCKGRVGFIIQEAGDYVFALQEGEYDTEDVYKCPPVNLFLDNEFNTLNSSSNFNINLILDANYPIDSNSTGTSPLMTSSWGSSPNHYLFKVE